MNWCRCVPQRGSSLVEVLVAAAILALLLGSLLHLFGASRFTLLTAGNRSGAVGVGRAWAEQILSMEWAGMELYLDDPENGFVVVEAGSHWVREFAPEPGNPRYETRVEVISRRLRAEKPGDVYPLQLVLRDLLVTVRWQQKGSWASVQFATTKRRR